MKRGGAISCSSESSQKASVDREVDGEALPIWYHLDNGCSSLVGMDSQHQPLVTLAYGTLADVPGRNVLDLGCGNAALLKKMHLACPGVIPYGVDTNPAAISHAAELLPQFAANFQCGDLFDANAWSNSVSYALTILMVGRLVEVPRWKARRLTSAIAKSSSWLLLYVYPGWSTQSFEVLVQQAGLKLYQRMEDAGLVEAKALSDLSAL